MFKIPDNSILLIPGNLHLPVYKEIYQQKHNCLHIEVYPLETYIDSFLLKKESSQIEILYAYQKALQNLEESNAFYASRNDVDFLNALLSFVRLSKMYRLKNFPQNTQKDKDLLEMVQKVQDIPLKEDQISEIKKSPIPFDQIYILKKEYNEVQSFWVHFFIENKAHWIENETEQAKKYWSAANARKEIEVTANEIIDQNYKAEDIFIALAEEKDQFVLSQIFDAHQIPYTFLNETTKSQIPAQWCACLKFIRHKCEETYLDVLKTVYPQSSLSVQSYLALFENVRLNQMQYEPNSLVHEDTFMEYQRLETECMQWISSHAFIKEWNLENLESVGQAIQNVLPNPNEEDILAFDSITQTIAQANPYLKSESDLSLLIQYIERFQPKLPLKSIKGVLIGQRQDISCLRPIVFYVGAHAKVFPNLSFHSGIFDENYLANTDFIPLQDRLQKQRKQIFECLSQPKILYVLVPQSDYRGKSFETSHEMNDWMKQRPQFKAIKDPSFIQPPTFNVSKENSQQLFFKDQMYHSSYSRLHTFKDCPLKHYLRYGLALKSKREKEPIQIRKEFLEKILQTAHLLKNKQYQELTYEDVLHLVENEFHFAMKLFPQKKSWFKEQIYEYAFRIHTLLDQLNILETKWHLQALNKEYQISENSNYKDIQIEMKGALQAYDAWAASFLLMTPDHPDPTQPIGSYDLSMNQKAEEHHALDVSYRTALPTYKEPTEIHLDQQALENTVLDNWKIQNIPDDVQNDVLKKIKKKTPTYQQQQEKLNENLQTVLENIEEGNISPFHSPNACVHCPYKAICRNSAKGCE